MASEKNAPRKPGGAISCEPGLACARLRVLGFGEANHEGMTSEGLARFAQKRLADQCGYGLRSPFAWAPVPLPHMTPRQGFWPVLAL